ncbi:MAG: 2-oxoglutarate dehydrogenase component OdhB [Pseudomonadota bacterium]|jgi:2-oxoglutarate dehydrogenase E2 component (dihydrolipoamide succinyltransferase)
MAIINVVVPQLSESVAEATLLDWKKKVGQAVIADETLIEVETDKVVLEVPAPQSGILVSIVVGDGGTVTSNQLLATIDTDAKTAVAPAKPAAAPVKTAPTPTPAPVVKPAIAMPAAAKIAADNAINLNALSGSGKDGRITKGDVLHSIANPVVPPVVTPTPVLQTVIAPINVSNIIKGRTEQRVPMSRLRARIAERLLQSQASNATLTTFNEVNMAPVIEMRKRFQEKFEKEHGVKIGFMSFFIKAAVAALKKYPVLNASVDGNDVVYHGYFDIGVAVGSPRGLVVPIVRNADQMSFADIEKKIAEFSQKANNGSLSIEDMTGGTFSISNGGVFGSMLSTPIINPPQSAILGVHATKDRAVVENGEIVIRPMNYLALSYDHRIIDGREAVLGLVAMKEALEDPTRLLFDI